jgi:hypothetical protein
LQLVTKTNDDLHNQSPAKTPFLEELDQQGATNKARA